MLERQPSVLCQVTLYEFHRDNTQITDTDTIIDFIYPTEKKSKRFKDHLRRALKHSSTFDTIKFNQSYKLLKYKIYLRLNASTALMKIILIASLSILS